jgi:SAM-dependent methyltransferase
MAHRISTSPSRASGREPRASSLKPLEGWHGWDEYAAYYDWENARTVGRRDVAFWRRIVMQQSAPTLELGCGTGRLLVPLARAGARMTGIDRSTPMLARTLVRARRLRSTARPWLLRGDIRALPFPSASFGVVMAPYGLLQSLVRESDLSQLLGEVARVLRPGGLLGIDLVPDLPKWREYTGRVSLRGASAHGSEITLVESVRQDRRRGLTMFDETFVERSRGGRATRRSFTLTFRTLSMEAVIRRLERHGFRIEARWGSYEGDPWTPAADVWVVLARLSAKR